MNTNAKGYRNETKTKEYLEALGFKCINTVRSSYKGSNDFFGLFDTIAVCDRPEGIDMWTDWLKPKMSFMITIECGETLYVQTTSNRNKPKAVREAIAAFPATNKQIFIWYDRIKEPKIITL